MNKTIILKTNNGDRQYSVKELDFTNVACDLEDYGVNIFGEIDGKMMSLCRAIIGIITGTKNKRQAGIMLSEHLKNGGTLDEVFEIFREAMEVSGFGQATVETANTEPKAIVQMPVQVIEESQSGSKSE